MLIQRVRIVGGGSAPTDVRIADGVVTEVGPDLAPIRDEVLAADGRWVIPGLWDAHVHFTQWARSRSRLDLGGTTGPEDVLARVRDELAQRADRTSMLVGFGFRTAGWERPGTTAELDAISGDHPVVLISGDVHCGWLNSAAARAVGLTPPEGLLAERDWFAVMPAATELAESAASLPGAVAAAVEAASALGVVGINDFEMTDGWAEWPQRHADGLRGMRVRPAVYPDRLPEVLALGLRTGKPLTADGLVTMGPLKIISDGSLNTRTAFCHAPYADDPTGGRGQLNYSPDQLRELLASTRTHSLQVALHAIGDAAVANALDALSSVAAIRGARRHGPSTGSGNKDHGPGPSTGSGNKGHGLGPPTGSGSRDQGLGSIEHAQLVDPADMWRMAQLGVVASVQPAHLLDDRDVTLRCWPDVADRCFPLRSLRDAGVRLVLGSDAPVSPLDPWLAMAAAVHRSADDRPPWNPAEAISPSEALAASTDSQRVRVGDRGDLVLLDTDPLAPAEGSAAAASLLRAASVTATIVDGRLVYSYPSLSP